LTSPQGLKFLPKTIRNSSLLLAAAIFLIGLGHIALLPPFEGSDEVAHYSSIEQITESGSIPFFGTSHTSGVAVDYRRYGPLPRTVVMKQNNGVLVYKTAQTMSYTEFFAMPALKDNYILAYHGSSPVVHEPSANSELNWEAQHPPFYYLLMAAVM